MTENSL